LFYHTYNYVYPFFDLIIPVAKRKNTREPLPLLARARAKKRHTQKLSPHRK